MLPGARSHRSAAATITVPMFSKIVRSLWLLVLACMLVSELVPLTLAFEAHFSTLVFHSYEVAKLVMLVVFGFLTPLSWWRYKSLGAGAIFAIATTVLVEVGQTFIPGHRTSILELAVKLVCLFAGFAAALDVRKYQQFVVGPLCIRFSSSHWKSPA